MGMVGWLRLEMRKLCCSEWRECLCAVVPSNFVRATRAKGGSFSCAAAPTLHILDDVGSMRGAVTCPYDIMLEHVISAGLDQLQLNMPL